MIFSTNMKYNTGRYVTGEKDEMLEQLINYGGILEHHEWSDKATKLDNWMDGCKVGDEHKFFQYTVTRIE